jgi:hypothetical protein
VTRRILTSSEIRTWDTCQKRWWFRYHEELVPERGQKALSYGRAVHAGLEAYHSGLDTKEAIQKAMDEAGGTWLAQESVYVLAEATALVKKYAEHDPVAEMGHTVEATERQFSVPLRTPSGRRWPSIEFHGKIDLATRDGHGNLWIWDHKTSATALKVQWLPLNDQMGYYYWAASQLGDTPVGIVYDLIRKPSIQPRKGEGADEWQDRLLADIDTRPDFYFQRAEIVKSVGELWEIEADLWDAAHRIGTGRIRRSPNACQLMGCPYTDICTTDSALMRSVGYKHERAHVELELEGVEV